MYNIKKIISKSIYLYVCIYIYKVDLHTLSWHSHMDQEQTKNISPDSEPLKYATFQVIEMNTKNRCSLHKDHKWTVLPKTKKKSIFIGFITIDINRNTLNQPWLPCSISTCHITLSKITFMRNLCIHGVCLLSIQIQ